MNSTAIIGNLARDPESRTTPNGKTNAQFTVAVRRNFKNQNGEYESDFFPCITWGATAEYVMRYAHKGSKVGVTGKMQHRAYTARDGSKRDIWELIADNVDLIRTDSAPARAPAPAQDAFEEVTDEDLPFDI